MIIADSAFDANLYRRCPRCTQVLPLETAFHNRRYSKTGKQTYCKSCLIILVKQTRDKEAARAYAAGYYNLVRDRSKRVDAWREANPEKVRAHRRAYYLRNRERLLRQQAAYRAKQAPADRSEYMAQWRASHQEYLLAYRQKYYLKHREVLSTKARERYRARK